MISFIVSIMEKVSRDFPILFLIMPYVGVFSILIIGIATLHTLRPENPIRLFVASIPDKIVLAICMVLLAIWVIFVTVFIFPFHCLKNWDQVKLIRENRRLKNNAVRR